MRFLFSLYKANINFHMTNCHECTNDPENLGIIHSSGCDKLTWIFQGMSAALYKDRHTGAASCKCFLSGLPGDFVFYDK